MARPRRDPYAPAARPDAATLGRLPLRWLGGVRVVHMVIAVVLLVGFVTYLSAEAAGLSLGGALRDEQGMAACRAGGPDRVAVMGKNEGHVFPAGHWFHVGELAIPEHAVRRQRTGDGGSAEPHALFIVLPTPSYASEMNAMTRMIMACSIASGAERAVHFLSPASPPRLRARPGGEEGQSALLPAAAARFTVDLAQDREERFVKDAGRGGVADRVCALYDGVFGVKWPTVQRGHWFPNGGDKEAFDAKVSRFCSEDAAEPRDPSRRRLVVYQRNRSRLLSNADAVVSSLREQLGPSWEVVVHVHDPGAPPCTLVRLMRGADVLLTPHGFQSMLMLFMPRGALVFEIYPYLYYKAAYRPLAGEIGVEHAFVTAEPFDWWHSLLGTLFGDTATCMKYLWCRARARDSDVVLNRDGQRQLLEAIRNNFH